MSSADWFVGFIEGECTFSSANDTDHSVPSFSVSQKSREVCDALCGFFGFGGVYPTHDNTIWEYKVQDYMNCRKVALFLRDRLVLAHRREQFCDWCKRFGLLDANLYYPSGRRIHGTSVAPRGSEVRRWMKEHPEEVETVAAKADISDPTEYIAEHVKEVTCFDSKR